MNQPAKRGGYWSGAHTVHRLLLHLVWIPKYRKRVLSGPLAARLQELLEEACQVNAWQLHELNVQSDHVHLLVQVGPKQSVSKVVQRLKGGTSRQIRAEFPDLAEFLWGESLWADGYFAESVGKSDEATIRRYIREQRKPAQNKPID